ncbi:MAG: ABC transporter permease [Dehalococcoidia bacterium]|nr:ABC transporter permease [Dehalococcoidia bacterium]
MVLLALSARQLAGGKRIWLMLVLAAIPLVFAVIFALVETDATALEFSDGLTNYLIASTILPLVMLVLATASFGNELDDHTLPYLVLKPISRWTIVAPKLLASLLVGGLPVAVSGWLSTLIITEGDAGHAAATAAALLVGAVAYAALFTWAGLTVRYALPFGVAYIFVWEAVLSTFLDGTRFLSVRQYTLAVVHGIDDSRLRDMVVELGLAEGLIGAAVMVAVFTTLTTRRLARMDIP